MGGHPWRAGRGWCSSTTKLFLLSKNLYKIDSQSTGPRDSLARRVGYEEVPCPAMHRAEWLKCRDDVIYWIERYVQTFDPRRPEGDRWTRFVLYPRQKEYLLWLKERDKAVESCMVKKCRDVGATWLTLCYFAHAWVFERDAKMAVGSRKIDLVDRSGDIDTLFEKLREVYKGLPDWMRPTGMRPLVHDRECILLNPVNGSVITGEGGTKMGTGGRNGKYLLDEFAKVEDSVKVQAAVEDNCPFRVYVSTPEGVDNEFARMYFDKAVPVFEFNFRDVPPKADWVVVDGGWRVDKTESGAAKFILEDGATVVRSGNGRTDDPQAVWPWYEEQRATRHPVNLAQEVDGDFFASVEDVVCAPEWVRAAMRSDFEGKGFCFGGLDLGGGGKRKSTVLAIRQGARLISVSKRGGNPVTALESLAEAVETAQKAGAPPLVAVRYDASGDTGKTFADSVSGRDWPFMLIPHFGQKAPSNRVWRDGKRSSDKFANLRAEAWWLFRERLRKTYERNELGFDWPDEECACLVKDDDLARELAMVRHVQTETGKTKIMSKTMMRAEGFNSPDSADAVVMAFYQDMAPEPMKSRFERREVKR